MFNTALQSKIDTFDYSEPFWIESMYNGTHDNLKFYASGEIVFQWSIDKLNWTDSRNDYSTQVPTNTKVYLRANTDSWAFNKMYMENGDYNIGGNIMSLLYGSSFNGTERTLKNSGDPSFQRLFSLSTGNTPRLINAENLLLPATSATTGCYTQLFENQSRMVTVPLILPATTLGSGCYTSMFKGCSSITSTPILPAKTLDYSCYNSMFYDCTSLTTAPELPASVVRTSYAYMFYGCTSLTETPEFPVFDGNVNMQSMFEGCTNLTTIHPIIKTPSSTPNLNLNNTFKGCNKVTSASIGLNDIDTTYNTNNILSWESTFENCTSLNEVTFVNMLPKDVPAVNKTFNNVASTGTFKVKQSTIDSWADVSTKKPWNVTPVSYNEGDYDIIIPTESITSPNTLEMNVGAKRSVFTISPSNTTYGKSFTSSNTSVASIDGNGEVTAVSEGQTTLRSVSGAFANTTLLTVTDVPPTPVINDNEYLWIENTSTDDMKINTKLEVGYAWDTVTYTNMEYSYDKSTWNTVTITADMSSSNNDMPLVPAGDKVYLRALAISNPDDSSNPIRVSNIYPTKSAKIGGNPFSMVFGSNFTGNETSPMTINGVYVNCPHFEWSPYTRDASELAIPTAMNISNLSFHQMFQSSGLRVPPQLRYTQIPVTTTIQGNTYGFYEEMFSECTSLQSAPDLPATSVGDRAYRSMFQGCSSLTTPPSISATTLGVESFEYMFMNCINLTAAPQLNATTVPTQAYTYMFKGCTSLVSVPSFAATTLGNATTSVGCCEEMFYGCTSLTTLPSSLPATTLNQYCYKKMFYGCTSLQSAPVLPATQNVNHAYEDMFYGCSSLNSITCLLESGAGDYYMDNWVNGVAANGTFTKADAWWPTGTNGIPSGWTVVEYSA